jgi:HPt (histidine-containing phosphotransfer) domain-containing protein
MLDKVLRQWVQDKDLEELEHNRQNILNGEARKNENVGNTKITIKKCIISGLDIISGIKRFNGDEDAYCDVLRSFAANTPPLLEIMREAGEENIANYTITVHGIKGSSRGICAGTVADKAEALEMAALSKDYAFISAHNEAFLKDASELLSEIDAALSQANADMRKQKKDRPDAGVLHRILEACRSYDMDMIDAAVSELERYEYETGGEIVPWLWENVQQFNLSQIIEKLSDISSK